MFDFNSCMWLVATVFKNARTIIINSKMSALEPFRINFSYLKSWRRYIGVYWHFCTPVVDMTHTLQYLVLPPS